MIKTFRSKPLADLCSKARTSKIDVQMHERIPMWLDRLDPATMPEELNLPGFDFHTLKRTSPTRYTVHVNGPWRITFEFHAGDAYRVDFVQCH